MQYNSKIIGLITFGVLTFGGSIVANAESIDLGDNAPKSGSVTLDDNDNVVSSSSDSILDAIENAPKNVLRSAVNFAHSRWVYYSDNHNYLNGYKEGHSNYRHNNLIHSSTAQVGSSKRSATAGAGSWSYATAKGKGTFKAFYDAAYK